MHNERGYKVIVTEAERVGWPTDFKNDLLIHDFAVLLSDNAPEQFGWVLHETGTDLFAPAIRRSHRWESSYMGSRKSSHYYWYDGEELKSVQSEELFQLLARNPSLHV
jgi:hypothetical protein